MKIGLVLSGGGIRGVAHLGLLKALEEFELKIHMISGTSAGALAGAFYATGMSPDDILELTMNLNRLKFIHPVFSGGGLLNNKPLLNFIRKNLPEDKFEKLKIKLVVSATTYKNARSKYFDKGDLIMPLLASSTVPVIYKPVDINGQLYVDGGIVNNLPVEPLVGECSRIIGSLCNPIDEDYQRTTLRAMLERVMLININTNTYNRRTLCDVLLEPSQLKNIRVFDFSKTLEIFNIAYYHTLEKKDEILQKLSI